MGCLGTYAISIILDTRVNCNAMPLLRGAFFRAGHGIGPDGDAIPGRWKRHGAGSSPAENSALMGDSGTPVAMVNRISPEAVMYWGDAPAQKPRVQ